MMAGSNCAFNSAAALRRVFIPSILETSNCLHVTRIFVPALLSPFQHQQTRSYNIEEWLGKKKSPAGSWGSEAFQKPARKPAPTAAAPRTRELRPVDPNRPGPRVKTKLARLPRDDEIRAKYVYLQERHDDGVQRLGEKLRIKDALAMLDRKTETLQVIREPNPDDPSSPWWPVAVIVNKKQEVARKQKEKEQQKKQKAASKEKELEFNWAVAPHDIEHKLRTLQKFLAKGWKVQLLLLKKSGKGVKASKKQAEELLGKVMEAVAEVKGSTEWKGREGELLGSMRIFLQGKLQETEDTAQASKGKGKAAEQSA